MIDKTILAQIEKDFSAWQKNEVELRKAVEARIANGENLKRWLQTRRIRNWLISRSVPLAKPFAEWLEAHPLASDKAVDISTYLGYVRQNQDSRQDEYLHDIEQAQHIMDSDAWRDFIAKRNKSLEEMLAECGEHVPEDTDADDGEIIEPLERNVYRIICTMLRRMRHPPRIPTPEEAKALPTIRDYLL